MWRQSAWGEGVDVACGCQGRFFFVKTQNTFVFHFIEKVEFGFTILLAGKHTVQHTGEAVNSPTPIEVGELMEEPDTYGGS